SPQQPGLMMALERGGSCEGIACRLPDAGEAEQVGRLLRREVGEPEDLRAARWVTLDARGVRLRALAFWVGSTSRKSRLRLPADHVAQVLARACGHLGSGAEYLFHTVCELEHRGIHDRGLWHLQQLVADEILRMEITADKMTTPRLPLDHDQPVAP